jgi:ABC-type nitrate/sulfonate/bicarbonate transport system substrate-binding protein
MRRPFALVTGIVLAATVWCHPSNAQTLQKIRVTIPVPVFTFFPLYYGQENGFFAKEGLDVETISTNGDGPDVDSLIAGSVQFTIACLCHMSKENRC